MSNSIEEPDQLVPLPEDDDIDDDDDDGEGSSKEIWNRNSIVDYVLLIVVVIILLAFLIPKINDYFYLIYFLSILSYAAVIFYVYYVALKNDKRDLRIALIFFIFLFVLSQLFNYYISNNMVILTMYIITLGALLYIIIRGWSLPMVLILLVPIIYLLYNICSQIYILSTGQKINDLLL